MLARARVASRAPLAPRAAARPPRRARAAACAARINSSVRLEEEKVVDILKCEDAISEGGKAVYCRCWRSGTFPGCDGAHVAHNKVTGDNVGPLILSRDKPAPPPSLMDQFKDAMPFGGDDK